MSTINERFCKVRKHLDLTQTEFAALANRTRSEISNIEYNKTSPKEEVIKAVCAAHGINRRYLEFGDEPMILPKPDEDFDLIDRFMEDSDNPMRDVIAAIIKTYMQSDQKDKEALKNFAASFPKHIK